MATTLLLIADAPLPYERWRQRFDERAQLRAEYCDEKQTVVGIHGGNKLLVILANVKREHLSAASAAFGDDISSPPVVYEISPLAVEAITVDQYSDIGGSNMCCIVNYYFDTDQGNFDEWKIGYDAKSLVRAHIELCDEARTIAARVSRTQGVIVYFAVNMELFRDIQLSADFQEMVQPYRASPSVYYYCKPLTLP